MDQSHITEEELHEALESYRCALDDALHELGTDADRDAVITRARKMLGDDEPDQQELVIALAESDHGEPVWNLEEEIIDDDESVVPVSDSSGGNEESDDDDDESVSTASTRSRE
ncbi:MAG: hypothetical protein ACTHZ9_00925 [Leucobacter sp.]